MDYYLPSKMKLFPLDENYNEHSLGNIISLFGLMQVEGIVITLDSREGYGFNVLYKNKLYVFLPFATGLYYFDTRTTPQQVSDKTKLSVSPYSLLRSVDDNKEYYSIDKIKRADADRQQQEEIG